MSNLKDPKNQKLINDFIVEHAPLIEKNINVLKSKGKIPPNIEEEALHSVGFHGLMDALHKYDHNVASRTSNKEGENAFAKYAEQRIKGKMLDHIASQDPIPKRARIRAKNLEGLSQQTTPTEPKEVTATPMEPAVIKKPE
jgi:RNA polymerase sigma factor FliA